MAAQHRSLPRREGRDRRVFRQTGNHTYVRLSTGSRLWEAEGQRPGLHYLQPGEPAISVTCEGSTGQISENEDDFRSSSHRLCRQLSPLPPTGLGLDFFQPMQSRTEHPVTWGLRKRPKVNPQANLCRHPGRSLLQVWKQNLDSLRGLEQGLKQKGEIQKARGEREEGTLEFPDGVG